MLPGHQLRRQWSEGVDFGGAAVARRGGGAVGGAAGRAEAEADALRPGQGGCRCQGMNVNHKAKHPIIYKYHGHHCIAGNIRLRRQCEHL